MSEKTMKAFVQLSQAHADDDKICVTIIREPDVHIRGAFKPEDFVNALCNDRKVEGNIVRWRVK